MTRIAMQMYTVRNYGTALDERLALVREAGFSYVEMSLSDDLEDTFKLLDKHDITPVSSGFNMGSWDDKTKVEENFSFLKHYGARGSMNGFFDSEDENDWKVAAAKLEEMAQEFNRRGLVLEYHNHDHEYRRDFGSRNALDVLFDHAPSLKYQMDIGWVTAGGEDPVAMIDRYGRQLSSVHVKDLTGDYKRGSGEIMPDLGDGGTPIPSAVEKAREFGITDFVVENDVPADIRHFCNQAYKYLTGILQ